MDQTVRKKKRLSPWAIVGIVFLVLVLLLFGYFAFIILLWGGAFNALMPEEICTFESPDGALELTFYQLGDPAWPFGPSDVRLTLRTASGKKKASVDSYVQNDGGRADEQNIKQLDWSENGVTVTLRDFEGNGERTIVLPPKKGKNR